MTFAVDWALNNNYLIYLHDLLSFLTLIILSHFEFSSISLRLTSGQWRYRSSFQRQSQSPCWLLRVCYFMWLGVSIEYLCVSTLPPPAVRPSLIKRWTRGCLPWTMISVCDAHMKARHIDQDVPVQALTFSLKNGETAHPASTRGLTHASCFHWVTLTVQWSTPPGHNLYSLHQPHTHCPNV